MNKRLLFAVLIFWALCFSFGIAINNALQKDSTGNRPFTIQVLGLNDEPKDTDPPVISAITYSNVTLLESLKLTISSNEEINQITSATQSIKPELKTIDNGKQIYDFQITDLKFGENNIDLSAFDINGNKRDFFVSVNRYSVNDCLQKISSKTVTIDNPDSLIAFVNKNRKVPDGYEPTDMANLKLMNVGIDKNIYTRMLAYDSLMNMLKDMWAKEINISINSGWRSVNYQQKIYNDWVANSGVEKASQYAALPGFSEHHLGTAFDFTTSENNNKSSYNFANTKAGKWLQENAYMYGFVMSYSKDATSITGYNYEPWHYRYVGAENATTIKNRNISLTEFLIEANLPNSCI